ncbi:hypothetical protein DVH05_003972 [Phytophthora capsici]|nr:hypothetical protein DVH05_003972 [Phytophthora capsici]
MGEECTDITLENLLALSPQLPSPDGVAVNSVLDPSLTMHSLEFDSSDFLNLVGAFEFDIPTPNEPQLKPDTVRKENNCVAQQPIKRKGLKQQIEELRETVALLSRQLDSLKTSDSPSKHQDDQLQRSVWGRIATRQLQLLQDAEKENAKLRSLQAHQRRDAKNLKRLFRRRIDTEIIGRKRSLRRPKHIQDLVDKTKMFSKLQNGCNKLYSASNVNDFDAVFPRNGTCQVRHNVDSGVFVEFYDKHIVPFSVKEAAKAVWQSLRRRKIPRADHIYAEEYHQTQNATTTYMYISFVCSLGGTTAYMQEHGVAQKFVEEQRTLFVGQKLLEPAGNKPGFFRGLRFHETMRVVVRSGLPLASKQETAFIETHLAVSRIDDGSKESMAFRASNVVNLAVQGWDRKLSMRKQEIENLLFTNSLSTVEHKS